MVVGPTPKSLRWQLVSRVATVLGVLMVLVNIGFFLFLMTWLPDAKQSDESVVPDVAASIVVTGEALGIKPDAIAALRKSFPDLWFAARDGQGRQVTYGNVPKEFEPFLGRLSTLRVIDVRDEDGSPLTASLTRVETEAGTVHLIYGGQVPSYPRILTILWGLKMVYIPFTIAPVLVVFVAIPLIVARALAGVGKTTSRAAAIDARSLGVRLPTEDVVEELHPLVDAVNAALARIDEDVSRRQRFLTNAAHELRTPIAILQTRIEAQPAGPGRERLLLDVKRLAATAEQLLDLQRFSMIQTWSDVDLVPLCETVAADIAPIALAAGYDVGFEAEVKSFVVKGDYPSLERAVTNLAINAVEHGGGHGRILIEVSTLR